MENEDLLVLDFPDLYIQLKKTGENNNLLQDIGMRY